MLFCLSLLLLIQEQKKGSLCFPYPLYLCLLSLSRYPEEEKCVIKKAKNKKQERRQERDSRRRSWWRRPPSPRRCRR